MSRECGTCTKCCEGYLQGSVKGKPFYKGKPCHFVAIGKGCSIYEERPNDPCIIYKCAWLVDENIPEWFKPNEINAIVDIRTINGISYYKLTEAGETLRAEVLSWMVLYALNNSFNFYWIVKGGHNWIGSQEFIDTMSALNPND